MTNMHYSSYSNSRWKIYSSEEYEVWFGTLDSESKEAVLERVLLLEAFGPNAILLTGGDKKGKNEERFYKNLIAEADRIIEKHEQEMNR